jgi:hypothetical protein
MSRNQSKWTGIPLVALLAFSTIGVAKTGAAQGTPPSDAPSEEDSTPAATETAPETAEKGEPAATPAPPPAGETAPALAEPEKKESSWTDHIKLKGDFRYRFEILETKNMEMRYRHRIRARVGVIGQIVDDVEVGVQLATGEDDPVSTNQTLDNAFSTKPLWLDLGYVKWAPSATRGIELVAGKMENPFVTVGKSELLWDPDLTPEGIALGYRNGFGMVEPFVQTVGYYVEERSDERDSWILGAQGGLKLTFLDGILYLLVGAGYIDHTNIEGNEVYFEATDSKGNSAELSDPTDPGSNLLYLYDYNLVESFVELGGKAGPFPWAVFGTTVVNVEAESDNLGWLTGISFGKVKKALDFDVRYIYRQVQKDAVVGIFTDSDFRGGGTDGAGHEWNAGLGLAENVKLAVTYFLNERPRYNDNEIPGVDSTDDTEIFHRWQVDFKFKF